MKLGEIPFESGVPFTLGLALITDGGDSSS
jgi:hypothetical protein